MGSGSARTAFDDSELGRLDAVETAERIHAGDLKVEEVIAAAVERARTLGPALNAIPVETYDAALRRAQEPLAGPFAGVPTFVKAIDDVAGVVNETAARGPTRARSRATRNPSSRRSSPRGS